MDHDSARAGETVKVTGANFVEGMTQVELGGTTATAQVGGARGISDVLTFVVPPEAAVGDTYLYVRTPYGRSLGLHFVIDPSGAPTTQPPATVPTDGLARTGTGLGDLLPIGVGLVMMGGALLAARRRLSPR